MLMTIAGINDYSVDLSTYDFANIAKNFLMKYGMTEVDLDNWYKKMIN